MDTDRDFYLNADQALEYGMIDEILQKPDDGSSTARSNGSGIG